MASEAGQKILEAMNRVSKAINAAARMLHVARIPQELYRAACGGDATVKSVNEAVTRFNELTPEERAKLTLTWQALKALCDEGDSHAVITGRYLSIENGKLVVAVRQVRWPERPDTED